jgi:Rne/Rng family ribonuclease
MAKEICISSTPHETRLAILEDDQLAEIYYERENEYTLAGSVYNGRVTRVLPGMQSAFVDIGLERDAFLYVTDFMELDDNDETDELEKAVATGANQPPREVHHTEQQPAAERPTRREGRRERRAERTVEAQAAPKAVEIEAVAAPVPTPAPVVAPAEDSEELLASGGRRWRGRRRRGRRGVASLEPRPAAPAEAVEEAAVPAPRAFVEEVEELDEEEFTPTMHAAAVVIDDEPEPVAAEPAPRAPRSERKPRHERGGRRERAPRAEREARSEREPRGEREPRSERAPEPFVLPGEQLTKYGGAPAEIAAKPAAAAPTMGLPGFKPATLIESPIQWDGSGILPGESLSKHRKSAEEPSASHNIDPVPPSGFRLFGFGKKKDEKPTPAEEELIEEEFQATPQSRRPAKADKRNDSEYDFEEQTLPVRMRGELGEQLSDARQESRRSNDDTDEATPAAGGQRRERGGRGRRGRSNNAQPQSGSGPRRGPSRRSMQTTDLPVISDLLKPGQEILVQIAKEPIAKKGARITSHIALPGRFLVFMPTVSHVGVSRKIESDEERHRLKKILVHERGEATGGFIVRTAAEGASEEELRADLRFLMNLWNEIKHRSDNSKSPALIYHDLSLIERILRDQVSSNFANIWVDSEANYERIVRFLNRFSPDLVRRVKLYIKETPMFEHFGIEDEISKALRSKVWLKSGGSIVINQTEALVAIDINTGKYVGKSARLEDTIVKTNLDAVPEIVRQIRLRDLGGIIIIDFIDMDERKNRFRVMAALEEALKNDRAPTKVLQFNDFGLVAITRKRVKQSLERTLSVPCPTCQATGMVKSPTTVCNEIYVEMRKMKKHFEADDIMLRVHPETVKVLKSGTANWLSEFEELTGKNVLVKSDVTLHPEQFDVQG